jgi:hypothetical protein
MTDSDAGEMTEVKECAVDDGPNSLKVGVTHQTSKIWNYIPAIGSRSMRVRVHLQPTVLGPPYVGVWHNHR